MKDLKHYELHKSVEHKYDWIPTSGNESVISIFIQIQIMFWKKL